MADRRQEQEARAEQVLDDGYPFPREHPWWADRAEELARDVIALAAEVSRLESERDKDLEHQSERRAYWRHRAEAAEAALEAALTALRFYHVLIPALAECVSECGEALLYSDLQEANQRAETVLAGGEGQ